jgi:hypothetical protein
VPWRRRSREPEPETADVAELRAAQEEIERLRSLVVMLLAREHGSRLVFSRVEQGRADPGLWGFTQARYPDGTLVVALAARPVLDPGRFPGT